MPVDLHSEHGLIQISLFFKYLFARLHLIRPYVYKEISTYSRDAEILILSFLFFYRFYRLSVL